MSQSKAPSDSYDIVIIGGGITGAGIARDAALRGLRVALFEKGDFGSGTSSKSSKLVHGGLRYLEQAEFALVFESVSERRVQMEVAPHLVRRLPFLVPVYKGSPWGLFFLNIGLWIYEILALFRSPKRHRTLRGAQKVLALEPEIRGEGLTGAIEYYDCNTDDSRLVLENILDAKECGADCSSYSEVTEILRERGQVSAVRVRDVITGQETLVRTASIVMATGPWSDKSTAAIGTGMSSPILRPTKGTHVVFPYERLPVQRAIPMTTPVDKRVVFVLPWRGRTVIGTTDTFFAGDPDNVHADADDVDYLCACGNFLFPDVHLDPSDVIATWSGLRPLIHEEADSASEVSREHQIYVNDDGMILIAGGKLTTYRLMAKDTVNAAVRWLLDAKNDIFADREIESIGTKKRPLPGARDLPVCSEEGVEQYGRDLCAATKLPLDVCSHWAMTYGTRSQFLADMVAADSSLLEPVQSDLPFTWAEIEFAIKHELCTTIDDVLSRRVPLLLLGLQQGLDVLPAVADRMAEARGWDDTKKHAEMERYRAAVAHSRQFRNMPSQPSTSLSKALQSV